MDKSGRAKVKFPKGCSHREVGISSISGFTLLEVMVTFTVLGFILLMIFGVFRLGLSAWARGEDIKEEYQTVRMASQMISRQIKSIVPYRIKTQKAEEDYLAFEGNAHSLKFVSALPLLARQPEGFVHIVYEFKKGGEKGGRLILYEQKALTRDFMEENPREEMGITLLEGISDVRFEYYQGEDLEKNQASEWMEEWKAKERRELPKALRMTLLYKKKNEREEPALSLLISLPAHRFEEIRIAPVRSIIMPRLPGAVPREH